MTTDTQRRPLVSVILPAYQAEAYLARTVDSVLAQTVPDWELLILDDGSRDLTGAIAAEYAAADHRIRALPNPENLGVARTRNRGLELARGKWLAFLDSDDLWLPDKLERQLELAAGSGAELIYSAYEMFADESDCGRIYHVPFATDYRALLRENVIGCSTVLLLRSALGRQRFPEDQYHEDYCLWLRLLRGGCRAAGCSEVLVRWRIRESGRSFDKRNAAARRWEIYRRVEQLPFWQAASCFAAYSIRGLKKHGLRKG